MDDAGQCGRIVDEFLAAPGPAILEAVVVPFEPPRPGEVAAEQAAKFAQSLLRGEPNREKIVWTVLGDRGREMV